MSTSIENVDSGFWPASRNGFSAIVSYRSPACPGPWPSSAAAGAGAADRGGGGDPGAAEVAWFVNP